MTTLRIYAKETPIIFVWASQFHICSAKFLNKCDSSSRECKIFANLLFQLYLTLTWGKVAGAKHTNITREQAAAKTHLALRL